MPGIERVICVIGTREVAGPNSAEFVDYGGVRNLVDAARAAGVRHFVLLTAIGTTDPEHPFNKFTKGALQWRFKGEEHLRDYQFGPKRIHHRFCATCGVRPFSLGQDSKG